MEKIQSEIRGKKGVASNALRFFRTVVPWLVTACIFAYIFNKIPLSEVIAYMKQVRFGLFFAAVLVTAPFFYTLDTLCYHLAFNWVGTRTRYREVLIARGGSYILAMINFYVGQGGMALWVTRKKKMHPIAAAGIVLFQLFLGLYMIISLSAFGLLVLVPRTGIMDYAAGGEYEKLVRFTTIAFALLTFQALLWSFGPHKGVLNRLIFWGPFKVLEKVRFHHLLILFFIKIVSFMFEIVGCMIAFKAFGVDVSFAHLFAYVPLVLLIGTVPITVLHLGTTQAAWLWFFKDLIKPATILAYSLLWQTSFIFVRMLVGLACLRFVIDDFRPDNKKSRSV